MIISLTNFVKIYFILTMGNNDPSINVIVCGVNGINSNLTEKLFPIKINDTERKIQKEDIFFSAKLFPDRAYNNLNQIRQYINQNIRNNKDISKDIILVYPDEAGSIGENLEVWRRFAEGINELPEVRLPFIIFLTHGTYEETRAQIFYDNGDIFNNFKDKRKISIIKIDREEGINIQEIRQTNYEKILSLLWEINQILNQQPFKASKLYDANLFRMEENDSPTSVKILMSGFSRKGKSTFINLIFDKIVSLESPSVKSVTSNTVEFIYRDPDENANEVNFRGGIKIYDVPGLLEGTQTNINCVKKELEKSLENEEKNLDVINYIVFILGVQPNFENQQEIFKLLNNSGIKVIFIINENPGERSRTTKETIKDYFQRNFKKLILNNGDNILEADIKLQANIIFEYIYNDLINRNHLNNIENKSERELFKYLKKNTAFFSKINSRENYLKRAENKAKSLIFKTQGFASLASFSPIPFVDVPIILYFIAKMIMGIFIAYGFDANEPIIDDFFKTEYGKNGENALRQVREQENNNNLNAKNLTNYIISFYQKLSEIIKLQINSRIRYIIAIIFRIFIILLGIDLAGGYLDFIPIVGTIIQGIIGSIINSFFIQKLSNKLCSYCRGKIMREGAKNNILNQVIGYRKSILLFQKLSQREDWSRKIQIIS